LFAHNFLIFSIIIILFLIFSSSINKKNDISESFKPLLFLIITSAAISLILQNDNSIKTSSIAKYFLFFSIIFFSYIVYLRYNQLDFKNFITVILCSISIFGTYYFFDLVSIRYHSSPDNHGFASTIGSFLNNFSYDYHANRIMIDTGLSEAVLYGQETPNYKSTWNIPDAQLRFTGDMVFTVGRIGIPLLMSLMISFFDPIYSFPALLMAFGILGSFYYGLFNVEMIENIYEIISEKKFYTSNLFRFFFIFIFALSPWVIVMVIEGALTQFFSILICQYYLLNIIKLINSKDVIMTNSYMLRFLTASLSISVVYPHASLLFSFITFFGILLIYQKSKINKLKNCLIFFFISFISLPAAYLILGDSYYHILESFLSNISGTPYNLHAIGVFELYPIIGFTLSIQDRGFDILYSSKFFALAQLIIFLLIIYFLFFKNKLVTIQNSIFLILPMFFSLPLLNMLIRHENLQSYIYLRHLCNLTTFCSPILISLLFINFPKFIKLKKIIAFILIFIVLSNFANLTKNYNLMSLPHNSLLEKEKFTKINSNKVLFFSDIPNHHFYSLTILGNFNYITDNWNPHIKLDEQGDNIYKVYEIIHDNGSISEFIYHGRVELVDELIGPISIEDFKNEYYIFN